MRGVGFVFISLFCDEVLCILFFNHSAEEERAGSIH